MNEKEITTTLETGVLLFWCFHLAFQHPFKPVMLHWISKKTIDSVYDSKNYISKKRLIVSTSVYYLVKKAQKQMKKK